MLGLLNLCFFKSNVMVVIANDGIPLLLGLLDAEDESFELQASTLGALQSISYQRMGQQSVFQSLAIFAVFLMNPRTKLVTRALGVIHNISVYIPSLLCFNTQIIDTILLCLNINSTPEILLFTVQIIQNIARVC